MEVEDAAKELAATSGYSNAGERAHATFVSTLYTDTGGICKQSKILKWIKKNIDKGSEKGSSLDRLLLLLLLNDLDDRFRDGAIELFLFLQNVPVGFQCDVDRN